MAFLVFNIPGWSGVRKGRVPRVFSDAGTGLGQNLQTILKPSLGGSSHQSSSISEVPSVHGFKSPMKFPFEIPIEWLMNGEKPPWIRLNLDDAPIPVPQKDGLAGWSGAGRIHRDFSSRKGVFFRWNMPIWGFPDLHLMNFNGFKWI